MPITQVHLHKAIVEQVRVARRSLNRRSSLGSRPSSDWEDANFLGKKYSWAAGADGALSPAGSFQPHWLGGFGADSHQLHVVAESVLRSTGAGQLLALSTADGPQYTRS